MADHFNTAPGMPQTRAEVNRLDNDTLNDFMGRCDVEPADFDGCLACYAYKVAQDREAAARLDTHQGVLVCEGWWHPNTNAGRVHDHPANPGRGWSVTNHRLCEQVYTKRSAQ